MELGNATMLRFFSIQQQRAPSNETSGHQPRVRGKGAWRVYRGRRGTFGRPAGLRAVRSSCCRTWTGPWVPASAGRTGRAGAGTARTGRDRRRPRRPRRRRRPTTTPPPPPPTPPPTAPTPSSGGRRGGRGASGTWPRSTPARRCWPCVRTTSNEQQVSRWLSPPIPRAHFDAFPSFKKPH